MSESRRLVWISDRALKDLTDDSLCWYPRESGGLLLGYVKADEWVVTQATGPGPMAIHNSEAFFPDHVHDVARVREEFIRSNGVIKYLGDWHSHPGGAPMLSLKDSATLKRIAAYRAAQIRNPIMIICGGCEEVRLAAFSVVPRRWRTTGVIEVAIREFQGTQVLISVE